MPEIDTFNKYAVGFVSGGVAILNPPRANMTNDDALVLAAWLVALADPCGDRFPDILAAVQNG